jgi:hypothetical protein
LPLAGPCARVAVATSTTRAPAIVAMAVYRAVVEHDEIVDERDVVHQRLSHLADQPADGRRLVAAGHAHGDAQPGVELQRAGALGRPGGVGVEGA